jgi:TonB-linked SusC/RagA family outer membrane protein
LSYTLNDKYTVSGVVRRDGTSRLAKGTKYGTFPSVSVAWRISNEGFMNDIDWLSDLKLRASWGTIGNVQSIDTYGTTTSLSQWNYHLNQQPVIGYTLADAVNTDLVWESTTKKNIGLDAYFLNNQIYLVGDFFIEDTNDLLFRQPLPYSTGYAGTPFINAGLVRNTGIDLELGYRKSFGDWSLNISANISHFKNEVIDLEGRDLRASGIEEGKPLFTSFGYKTNGIIRTEEELANNPHLANKEVGDIWFLDIDGRDEDGNLTGQPDGIVNEADRTLIGNVFPDFSYGAFASLGYKNFTLQLQLQGVSGLDRDMRGGRSTDAFTGEPNVEADYILDRFHETKNPGGEFPEVSKDDAGQNGALSDFWLRDASYLSIRNVNLNYEVPEQLANKVGLQSFSVYGGVQNLHTFTSLYGTGVDLNFNPGLETNGNLRNTNPEGGNNVTSIPLPRVWTIGLKATF